MAGAVLNSIDELISRMGGPLAVARVTGRSPAAVCQWRNARYGIPPELYFVLRDACSREGLVAPAHLFGFETVEKQPA